MISKCDTILNVGCFKGTTVTHFHSVFVLNVENMLDHLRLSILKLSCSKKYTKTNNQSCGSLKYSLYLQSAVTLLPLISFKLQ